MISNLRSSECIWLLRMRALQRQLQVFTEMIHRRFFLVFLRSTSQYYTQLFLSQMHEIFTLSWPRFPETSPRLPKVSDEFPKTSERCRKLNVRRLFSKTFEYFWSYLKDDTFSVLWYDFVRTQEKDSKSSCVKNKFVRICESGVRNCPWCVGSMSLVHRHKTHP